MQDKSNDGESMTNPYEQRLFQIKILLNAYTKEDADKYSAEIEALQQERNNILKEIGE